MGPFGHDAARKVDVAVVGAGSAGAYTASRMAAAGLRVLVVERRARIRDRPVDEDSGHDAEDEHQER